jgi:single-strand selective monofunctional uracil DNA glycosylase
MNFKTAQSDFLDDFIAKLARLRFTAPVTHVYNPLLYARRPYEIYLQKYARPNIKAVLLGMNPGPWGMTQTGIPFGEVNLVRNWLGIQAPVDSPANPHPKRPVQGFSCRKSEVSGARLWGWARDRFETPQRFFGRFFVANYCPLVFMEESGRNRTPSALQAKQRKPLEQVCDQALRHLVQWLEPEFVIGVGRFATQRAAEALAALPVKVGGITHPSPANPRANRGWAAIIEAQLQAIGLDV